MIRKIFTFALAPFALMLDLIAALFGGDDNTRAAAHQEKPRAPTAEERAQAEAAATRGLEVADRVRQWAKARAAGVDAAQAPTLDRLPLEVQAWAARLTPTQVAMLAEAKLGEIKGHIVGRGEIEGLPRLERKAVPGRGEQPKATAQQRREADVAQSDEARLRRMEALAARMRRMRAENADQREHKAEEADKGIALAAVVSAMR